MPDISTILKDIYTHSAEMQKLADTKNAGLIAFNGAVIIGMTKLANDFWDKHCWLFYLFIYILIMCLISLFLCLAALVAQLRHHEKERMSFSSDNPLFFGKISQMKPGELVDFIKNRYKIKVETGYYECDLARQSIIMAQIALRKFKLFNKAFFWTIAGITTPIGAIVFEIFFNPNNDR
jgi:hypothetical protein